MFSDVILALLGVFINSSNMSYLLSFLSSFFIFGVVCVFIFFRSSGFALTLILVHITILVYLMTHIKNTSHVDVFSYLRVFDREKNPKTRRVRRVDALRVLSKTRRRETFIYPDGCASGWKHGSQPNLLSPLGSTILPGHLPTNNWHLASFDSL